MHDIQETLTINKSRTTWDIHPYRVDGWQIQVSDEDGNTLYDKRVIDDSLYEAVCHVAWEIWGEELEKSGNYELPALIANSITEPDHN